MSGGRAGSATMTCRVLPHAVADGPTNMAVDEALLDSVSADPTSAVVRTYGWSEPTLSLGYFQRIAEAEADPRWSGSPVLRRATGGGALWHDRELTYAVVVPALHPAARPSATLYRAIHGAIAARLRDLGVAASRRGDAGPGHESSDRPFLCFTDRDADDIVIGGVKLVGSAQRRRSGAVLQHGSILLGRSPTTPELAGLAELSSAPTDLATWDRIVRDALPRALGLSALDDEIRPDEWEKAARLRRDVYSDPGWTRRR